MEVKNYLMGLFRTNELFPSEQGKLDETKYCIIDLTADLAE